MDIFILYRFVIIICAILFNELLLSLGIFNAGIKAKNPCALIRWSRVAQLHYFNWLTKISIIYLTRLQTLSPSYILWACLLLSKFVDKVAVTV